ncbi:hypothetical protein CW304_25460 [Bacillus sp. UFRGS-B20]|nr:hypothetical protein CW304_25460 [Bacillus sp. UFRGS-B20]
MNQWWDLSDYYIHTPCLYFFFYLYVSCTFTFKRLILLFFSYRNFRILLAVTFHSSFNSLDWFRPSNFIPICRYSKPLGFSSSYFSPSLVFWPFSNVFSKLILIFYFFPNFHGSHWILCLLIPSLC